MVGRGVWDPRNGGGVGWGMVRKDETGCVVYTQVCAARPKQASLRQEARERQADTTVDKIFLFFNLVYIVSRETRERESEFLFQLNLNNKLKRILTNESWPVTNSTCIHACSPRA